jgi:hypothetical protein
MNQIVEAKNYGIEEKQANELLGNLPSIKAERLVLENQYKEIISLDIEEPETAKKARELRILIQKNRTQGINQWHKVTKDYFLKGGQFVDAIKRMEVEVNERMENQLEEIENYQAKKEAERKEALRVERLAILEPYSEFVPFGIDLSNLSDDDFQKTLNGAKLQLDAKIEAERIAEEKRIEAEKLEAERIAEEKRIEAERIEAQRLENERLKKEAEARELELEKERAKIEAERKKAEAEAEKIRKENEAKLKAEREAKAKIEAELQAKKDAEIKAENERLAKIEAERLEAERLAKAPIKNQLSMWVDGFKIEIPDNALLNNDTALLIKDKFEAFKKWSKSEIEKL